LKNKKRKLTTVSLPSPQRRKTANALTMGASSDTIMTGDDAHREAQVNLIHLPAAQRQQFYKQVFSKRVEPLTHISEPDECNEWPDLRDEILEAYLRYTTFSVKVWANYVSVLSITLLWDITTHYDVSLRHKWLIF
jgi:hypothetical protein